MKRNTSPSAEVTIVTTDSNSSTDALKMRNRVKLRAQAYDRERL